MDDTRTTPRTPVPNKGGKALRAYRRKLCETQQTFGKRYGLTFNAVSRYERGEYLPDLPLAVQFETDGICSCRDWCDQTPEMQTAAKSDPDAQLAAAVA